MKITKQQLKQLIQEEQANMKRLDIAEHKQQAAWIKEHDPELNDLDRLYINLMVKIKNMEKKIADLYSRVDVRSQEEKDLGAPNWARGQTINEYGIEGGQAPAVEWHEEGTDTEATTLRGIKSHVENILNITLKNERRIVAIETALKRSGVNTYPAVPDE